MRRGTPRQSRSQPAAEPDEPEPEAQKPDASHSKPRGSSKAAPSAKEPPAKEPPAKEPPAKEPPAKEPPAPVSRSRAYSKGAPSAQEPAASKSAEQPTVVVHDVDIGDICSHTKYNGRFIIQGFEDDKTKIFLGNIDNFNDSETLVQIIADPSEIIPIDLKLTITLPEEDYTDDVDRAELDAILAFFSFQKHECFKNAFIKFCKLFKVPYELARPLFINTVVSWTLHDMFALNQAVWPKRHGRYYAGKFLSDEVETEIGSVNIYSKPQIVNSETSMLEFQRKQIELQRAKFTVEQMDVLQMSPLDDRSGHVFGMIDLTEKTRKGLNEYAKTAEVKLTITPLQGKVIGAHKSQVTDINTFTHALQLAIKHNRIEQGVPQITSELATLSQLAVHQVIASTPRFNMQHLTSQLRPLHTDKNSVQSYERMVMHILALEYLTDVSYPLADIYQGKSIQEIYSGLSIALMYSDLELRLQLSQDPGTLDRFDYSDAKKAFIQNVGEMNIRRHLISNAMKDIKEFIPKYADCKRVLTKTGSLTKEKIDHIVRNFFTAQLKKWEIHDIEEIKVEKQTVLDRLPNTTIKSFLAAHKDFNPQQIWKNYRLTMAQSHELFMYTRKLHTTSSVRPIMVHNGKQFLNTQGEIFTVTTVDGDKITISNKDKTHTLYRRDLLTEYREVPLEGAVYQHIDTKDKYVVTKLNVTTIDIRYMNGKRDTHPLQYFFNSTIVGTFGRLGKRPTKKRHKKRKTRKGG